MASVQDRAKLKRVSYDTWSTREQLCLASSVLKAGDQNWIGVSRSLKPFAEKEALRPPDWFSQKSCAVQYSILLENADAPKRKKRESGETASESIVRRLTQERIAELGQILAFQRDEYQQLKAEVNLLRSGCATEEKLQKMWTAIEQEEREQEQKSRAHSVWLAKRQQKQDPHSSPASTLAGPQKSSESGSDAPETIETTNDDDEKKNRGGRSPLLTSLLKSPSPTTQIQNSTSSAQVTSPTIASLLGSSPKVPSSQASQNVSSQLHQLVASSMTANVSAERPSVGAPTLSMLLELPANLQRASLASLQSAVSAVSGRIPAPEMPSTGQPTKQTSSTSDATIARTPTINVTPNAPATESMVQIIDHIDDVIRKDIMADVIDKDEINEIIGDIEELIKEEITSSPRKITERPATPEVTENSTIPEIEKPMVTERPEPRDVDEPVSLSNSPQSEMAIEEIDQSTSSIAEIIGTVAIEPMETKMAAVPVSDDVPEDKTNAEVAEEEEEEEDDDDDEEAAEVEDPEESKRDAKSAEESPVERKPKTEAETEVIAEETKTTIEKETERTIEQPKEKFEDVEDAKIDEKTVDPISEISIDDKPDEKTEPTEPTTIVSDTDDRPENVEAKELSPERTKEKNDSDLDQIEMHLAEITGDRNETGCVEGTSVSSEVTNDAASIEDNEKSQDISTILEDDESSRSSSGRKKDADERLTAEVAIDGSESQESFKAEPATSDVPKETTIERPAEPDVVSEIERPTEKNDDEPADPEVAKVSDETTTPVSPEIPKNDNKIPEVPIAEPEKSPESVKTENDDKTSTPSPKPETPNVEAKKCESPVGKDEKPEIREEPETDLAIEPIEEPKTEEIETKDEPEETKSSEIDASVKKEIVDGTSNMTDDLGDLDEEESSLIKHSGIRAMKTYSKKQTIAVDSEPDAETSGENADYRAWKKAVVLMYNRLAAHKYASMFLRPITEDQAPGYHSVIFRPMDLSTIKKNIDNGTIRTTMHFQRDVMLMFQNAIMYNKHDTFVYKMAVSMQEECLQHMQILVQVTGEGQLRRETRTAASTSSETSNASAKRKRSNITPSPHDSDSPRGKKRRKSEND